MNCLSCAGRITSVIGDHRYSASGLGEVLLRGVEIQRCQSCDEEAVVLPGIESIHRKIAMALVAKAWRLAPEEIRFLRKYLDLTGVELAAQMGVTAETVSRWENGGQDMGAVADRLLRLILIVREVVPQQLDTLANIEAGRSGPLSIEIPVAAELEPSATAEVEAETSPTLELGEGAEFVLGGLSFTSGEAFQTRTLTPAANDNLATAA